MKDQHQPDDPPIVFVSPDASRTGAPLALLRLLGWLKRETDLRFRVLLYQAGPLAPEFAALAPTVTLTEVGAGRSGLVRRIGKFPGFGRLLKWIWFRVMTPRMVEQRPGLIYANSVASARLLRQVAPRDVPLVEVIATVAFGVPVRSPVMLLNHADQGFWVGCAVADLVLDMRSTGHLWTTHALL